MRCCEKHGTGSARRNGVDRKSFAGSFSPATKVRENFRKALYVRRAFPQVKRRFLYFGMPKKKLGQLKTCIARCSDYGDPLRVVHRSKSSMRFWTAARAF